MSGTATATKAVMRDAVRRYFPTGRNLATLLTHVSRGMAADAILDAGDLPDDEVAIVMLPQFAIRSFEGSESVNRIQWDERTIAVVRYGQTREISWQVEDSSLPTLTGTLTVTVGDTGAVITGEQPPLLNLTIAGNDTATGADVAGSRTVSPIEPSAVIVYSGHELGRHLRKISEHGRAQMFALATLLTPYARDAVNRASMRVHREIHAGDAVEAAVGHIIDEIERESVLDQLMLGTRQTDSVVIRLIRRVAATDITVRKSVMQVMATAIWSGAETQVRAHIGDPHLGRVIRRLARQLDDLTGVATVDATNVLEAYKREFPDQRVGLGRIIDALTAGATVHSQTVSFEIDANVSTPGGDA